MQSLARVGGVVLRARRQFGVIVGEREQPLEGGGAAGEGDTTGLIGKRHGDAGADNPTERLDRVELQLGEIIKAVQQNGCRGPQSRLAAQLVKRTRHERLEIGPTQIGQRVLVALKDRAKPLECHRLLTCLTARRASPQRTAQARWGDALALEVGHEPRKLGRHPWTRISHACQDSLASKRAYWCPRPARPAQYLAEQTVKALNADTKREPFRKLASVARLVCRGRHDQQRLFPMRDMRPHAIQQHMRLAGVGGSGYERDRHESILAHPPDGDDNRRTDSALRRDARDLTYPAPEHGRGVYLWLRSVA